jgi:hypothetical protein
MPNAILSGDVFATKGQDGAGVWRSTDAGKTWARTQVDYEGNTAEAAPEWSVVEVDGTALLGVSTSKEGASKVGGPGSDPGEVVMWRSNDRGASWNKTWHVQTQGWSDDDGFFGQTSSYVAASGKMLHAVRADTVRAFDNWDAMGLFESTDKGATWSCRSAPPCETEDPHPPGGVPSCIHPHTQCTGRPPFGHIGELYPRFTRLRAGKGALLTFTVRCGENTSAPIGDCRDTFDGHGLGLRAVVSPSDGESWDLEQDRVVLSTKDGYGQSGGGYGNSIQLANGDIISVYSYRGTAGGGSKFTDGKTHVEAVRWRLPDTLGAV